VTDLHDDLGLMLEAAGQAASIAMRYFKNEPKVSWKAGNSPVTEADHEVDAYLKRVLLDARPAYGWLSEETADTSARLSAKRTFVVDPIDGTRAFIGGKDVWCVSIAIVEEGRSIAGVLNCPARREVYHALRGSGAFRNGDLLPKRKTLDLIAISAPQQALAKLPAHLSSRLRHMPSVPSLAYRLAMIASGGLDATIVKPDSHDWDLAASALLMHECGASIRTLDGREPEFATAHTAHGVLIAAVNDVIDELSLVVRQLTSV
jgi:myo-inositol-1(or 4)-monophosphatase